jgi:N-acetylglucosaminyl-diphospho-decaprenol L-rhamnosyltransferase
MHAEPEFDKDPGAEGKVTVVTVAYNSEHVLPAMLKSLPNEVDLILFDNAKMADAELNRLQALRSFQYIACETNLGFGAACNRGAALARTEFVFFLNPDATLEEGCVGTLVDTLASRPDASAANPCIRSSSGRIEFKYRSVLLPRHAWRARTPPADVCEMPALTGGALFVRRNAFEQVGGFDEAIFLYHEDDDLSIRLRKEVGPLLYLPQAVVNHQAGHSSGRSAKVAFHKAYYKGQSRVYAMQKHGVPSAKLKCLLSASQELMNPLNLLSRRKRMQAMGFFMGVVKGTGPVAAGATEARSS